MYISARKIQNALLFERRIIRVWFPRDVLFFFLSLICNFVFHSPPPLFIISRNQLWHTVRGQQRRFIIYLKSGTLSTARNSRILYIYKQAIRDRGGGTRSPRPRCYDEYSPAARTISIDMHSAKIPFRRATHTYIVYSLMVKNIYIYKLFNICLFFDGIAFLTCVRLALLFSKINYSRWREREFIREWSIYTHSLN